jgi:hypothetical protein
VSDNYERTPLWGWVVIIAAVAMFVGLLLKSLSTGGGR